MSTPTDLHKLKEEVVAKEGLISEWREYYKRQRVITVIDETSDSFGDYCKKLDISGDDVAFIVLAPVTFLHLNDFKNGLPSAAAFFCFQKDGRVKIDERVGSFAIDFKSAFEGIAKRVTGIFKGSDVAPVETSYLLSEEQEAELQDKLIKFQEHLNLLVDKFAKLPAVLSAKLSNSSSVGALIDIDVKTNFPSEENFHEFRLEIGNKARMMDYWEGDSSSCFGEWLEKAEFETVEDLYKALVELSEIYLKLPVID